MYRVIVEVETVEQANAVMYELETALERGDVDFQTITAEPINQED